MTTGLTPVMELEADDGASASGTTITVFGTDRKDLTKLGTVRREIHVALLDPRTDAQSLYPATILHSGLLASADAAAGGISFSPRRCAYRKGQQFPTLLPLGAVDQAVLTTAEYFVTVRLGALDPLLVAVAPPARAAVMEEVADQVSPLLAIGPGVQGADIWGEGGQGQAAGRRGWRGASADRRRPAEPARAPARSHAAVDADHLLRNRDGQAPLRGLVAGSGSAAH